MQFDLLELQAQLVKQNLVLLLHILDFVVLFDLLLQLNLELFDLVLHELERLDRPHVSIYSTWFVSLVYIVDQVCSIFFSLDDIISQFTFFFLDVYRLGSLVLLRLSESLYLVQIHAFALPR